MHKVIYIRATIILIATLVIQFAVVSPTISAPNNEQGSSNGQPFQTLADQIDIVSGDLSEAINFLQQQIDELEISQADQDTLIASLQSALEQLALRVLQNETDIESLEIWQELQDQLIAALDSRLDDLEARVTANEGDIAAIILADQVQQQLIQANLQQINLINQLIAANAGDIDALELRAADLETDITNLQNDLNNKQDRVLGVCPSGSSIREIFADGSVNCQDNAGAGVGVLVATVRSATIRYPFFYIYSTNHGSHSHLPQHS
jgi:prefoldin subunit 5